ncbi:MAG: hypothetical protein ACRYHA_24225 [Janthinobacterium lividum]
MANGTTQHPAGMAPGAGRAPGVEHAAEKCVGGPARLLLDGVSKRFGAVTALGRLLYAYELARAPVARTSCCRSRRNARSCSKRRSECGPCPLSPQVRYDAKVAPRIAKKDASLWIDFKDVQLHAPQWIEQWNKQIGR